MKFEAASIEIVLKKDTTLILFDIYHIVTQMYTGFYNVLSKHLKNKIKLCLVVGDLNIF